MNNAKMDDKTILRLLEQEESKRKLEPWETALKDMKPLVRQLRVFCTSDNGYIDVQLFADFLMQEVFETIVATAMEVDDTKYAPRYIRAIMSHLDKEKRKEDYDFEGKEMEPKVTFITDRDG